METLSRSPSARPPARFGLFLTPAATAYPELLRIVQAAEAGGLELIGVQDHPYQPTFLDTFALIGDLLTRTERLRFFPDVTNLPLRPPAMLAKLGASLDLMSGGRFELGMGAGGFWDGIASMGGARRSPGESVQALDEAIEIIRRAWSSPQPIRFDGVHYRVDGFNPGPAPAHPIEIWVGSYKPKMLRLTGQSSDGWLPSLPYAGPEAIPAMRARIDDAANAAGRDPGAIRRIYNVVGEIIDGPTRGLLQGPVDHWVETLVHFSRELGFDDFVVAPGGANPQLQAKRLADEVAPAVREALQKVSPDT